MSTVLSGIGSLQTTTMTSADFSAYRNTEPNLRPPSVRRLSFNSIAVASTRKELTTLGLRIDVHTHPFFRASYALPVRRYRILQSRLLQTIPHGIRPCDLL